MVYGRVELAAAGQNLLSLLWPGMNNPGWYRYRVDLSEGAPETAAAAPFYLAVQVVPAVEVFPPAVAVADADWKQGWTRQIRCTFNRPFLGQWHTAFSEAPLADRIRVTLNPKPDGMNLDLVSLPGAAAPPKGVYTLSLVAPDGSSYPLKLMIEDVRQVTTQNKSGST